MSRTATRTWKVLRQTALYHAMQNGVTHCRYCMTFLDYSSGLTANAATPDHIIPYARGGKDHLDNIQIICRSCNMRLGDKKHVKPYSNPQIQHSKQALNW